ncbi:MAG TPA: endonuclease, partial [Bacteroidales bacterium]|nr:endonuclease [Bacteroidales bacterium]
IDSLKGEDPGALILAMGDFNDGPSDTSLQWLIADGSLLNLMLPLMGQPGGTHKHAGHWGILDQILVSPLLRDRKAWEAGPVSILSAPYLLQEETNQTGHRPFRSFAGNAYQGGFSDHLPVFVDLHYYGREH